MTERPILFSAPMVLALLAGTKTQTRRILKSAPHASDDFRKPGDWWTKGAFAYRIGARTMLEQCPYGVAGDRLWVRETWGYRGASWNNRKPKVRDVTIEYRADAKRLTFTRSASDESGIPKQNVPEKFDGVRRASECSTDEEFALSCEYGDWMTRWWKSWRPSIFMPRWASRLTLEVTDVRVERLQDIGEADAKAEGVDHVRYRTAKEAYSDLWESINGDGSWAKNPFVWAISFRRVQ